MKNLLNLLFLLYLGTSSVSYGQKADHWYILSLGGKPVGFYHESIHRESGIVRSEVQSKMKISRLNSEVNIESKQVHLESGEALKQVHTTLLLSKQQNIIKAEIEKDHIKLTNSISGKETESKLPYTGILKGIEGIRLLTVTGLKNKGDSIAYNTFIGEYGMVVKGTRMYLGKEMVEINGSLQNAIKVKDTFKGLPIVRTSWLDNDGYLLKSAEPNALGELTLLITNEKAALTLASAKVELAEDQYAATLAPSNVRLPQARRIESITIRIKHKYPEIGFPDLSGSYQEVVSRNKESVTLKITRPVLEDMKDRLAPEMLTQFTQSTAFINTNDSEIIETAKRIVGSETDPWKKALLIRDWANESVKFNSGIALAPSTEVIRNKEGTCMSFATITTTLCRAVGIPTRLLMGYAYVNGIWGGHAWAEVYIRGTWIPIDAILASPNGIADAARFHFSRSSLSNGFGECLIGASLLFSNIDVEVLDYVVDGKQYTPLEGGLYTVTEKKYSNAGLGISMTKLKGFEFTDLDHVYPNDIILRMKSTSGTETVSVYQKTTSPRLDFTGITEKVLAEYEIAGQSSRTTVQGMTATKVVSLNKAAIAIHNGVEVLVIIASGTNAGKLLDRSVKGLSLLKFNNATF